MGKRNKIRYTSKGNPFPPIILTGRVAIKYRETQSPEKGDLRLYMNTDSNAAIEPGLYENIGLDGYLKAEVWDGKGWCPVSLEEFFTDREYYFSKYDRPIDTMAVCLPILLPFAGRSLLRTYREHYVLSDL